MPKSPTGPRVPAKTELSVDNSVRTAADAPAGVTIPPVPVPLETTPAATPHELRGRFGSELGAVLILSAALTMLFLYPIASNIGSVGRVDNGDGQWSIWIVSWVARTLVVDPRHVFDANIFYPHLGTLAYSENNLGAGLLATPVYWATRNPYAAHNFVVLLAFVLSATGTYYLVRYLTGDRRAAAVSAISFAFCPYVFAHLAHIQLELTAGLPFTMLAFHRLADRPSTARGAALGALMAAQALCCGYYGVFAILLVGYAVFVVAAMRSLWRDRAFWSAIMVGAAVAIVLVIPAFLPYVTLQQTTGFHRPLDAARPFSANLSSYLASSSYAHSWMLPFLPPWREVAFPGFVATAFGLAGLWFGHRFRRGETAVVYGGATILAFWASFGPAGGLYTVLYRTMPVFSWMRAPVRFGLLVDFGLSVLAGAAVAVLLERRRSANLVAAALVAVVVGELAVPFTWPHSPPVEPVYQVLAAQPPGPVIEMPFFERRPFYHRHAAYMLASTSHWMPLVNGYSDYFPPEFATKASALSPFPFPRAFKILRRDHVRYALFHLNVYNENTRRDVEARLDEFAPYLRPLYADADVRLYEIIGFPPKD
jgi:hypothetical protein